MIRLDGRRFRRLGQFRGLASQRVGNRGDASLGPFARIGQPVEVKAHLGRFAPQDRAAIEERDEDPDYGQRQDSGPGQTTELARLQFDEIAPADRLVHIDETDQEPGDAQDRGPGIDQPLAHRAFSPRGIGRIARAGGG